jgi:hypothetical protein
MVICARAQARGQEVKETLEMLQANCCLQYRPDTDKQKEAPPPRPCVLCTHNTHNRGQIQCVASNKAVRLCA